jgi:hypothetical protein
MHRRPMVRREDNRPIGGAGIAPGLVPCPPLALILRVNPLPVNQKNGANKREKPNYSEFPNSWASGFSTISAPFQRRFSAVSAPFARS